MADEPVAHVPAPAEDETNTEQVVIREGWTARRVAKWVAIALGIVAALLGLAVVGINTGPGRAFVARQIGNVTLASGLSFHVDRIDGSLYGAMVLHGVEVRDQKGTFASAQTIAVDWRPLAYLNNRIDIRSAASPLIRIARLPELKATPSDPNAPLLPDLNIDIGTLQLPRIELAAPVTGQAHIARLAGSAHLSDGRAILDATGGTLAAPGIAGGDRFTLKLDAVPRDNKLDLNLRVAAPADGLIAGLAGLESPLTLSVDGDGSWKQWKGQAVGTLGGEQLADLALTARDGRFTVRGVTRPGLYLKGPVERLASPQLDVAIDTAWTGKRADTRIDLKSKSFSLHSEGIVDAGANRFGNFRTEALLLTPGAIADNLNGADVRAAILLNGPFARPVVDYKIQAGSLGFGEMRVERLFAEGRARIDSKRILVPVSARAARVTGLNAAAGGTIENLTLDGDLAISGDQILSDNLRLRSSRIAATAVIAADIGDGRYTGALKGRVNDYLIDSVAVINLTTDAELYSPRSGGWGIRGTVGGQSVRILNDGVRNFLGGNAVASARIQMDPNGIINIADVRLRAPQFRITQGSGRYDPAGPLLLNMAANSTQYGPLTARISGTATAPVVLLKAPRPGVGVGLANLEARIRGQGSAYAIDATGGTDYGPFSADVLVRTGTRLAVDVRKARFAGMDIQGKLVQAAAGPFEGRLTFAGSGVDGVAMLDAQGKYQRATINADASNAKIPGVAELSIGRAIVKANVLLTETPQVVGDVQIANLRSGAFVLKKARGKIDYQGGNGTAQLLATGSTGVPFTIAANAKLRPDLWLVALDGQGSRVKFHTAKPARIVPDKGVYKLLPTRVEFDKGSAVLAGTYGDGMKLQSRLEKLDLSVINALVPGLGIGGSATGSLDFEQATATSFPTANARLEISNFTRSSLAAVSTPVDVTFVGKLLPDGGDGRALIKRGGTTIGKMVATLRPLGPGAGPWTQRLMAAPLSGGIRYNGPATVLFSLAGLSDQQLTGPIGIAADFAGRVEAPELSGIVRASNLVYENETYGTRLTNMKIDGRFSNDQLIVNSLAATAGSGTVSAKGTIGLSAAQNFPMNLSAELNDARLARSDSLGATATGKIAITRDMNGGKIEGRINLPEARYEVVRQGAAEVPALTGVRRKSDVFEDDEQRQASKRMVADFKLDLRISADNRVFVSGMGLESEWEANIRVGGTTNAPELGGTAELVRGTYDFAGRRFTLTRGTIRFQGAEMGNPTIDIAGNTTTDGVTAVLNVSGTALHPRITFTSSPALPQDEVLSRLLFGNSVTDLSATEAIQLAAALNSLRGSGGGLNPLGKLRSAVGIDRLRILGADQVSGRGTALAAGQYITDDIYVEVITDARGFTATQLEIALTRALSVLSQTGSFGGSSVSIRYSKDY